MENFIRNDKKFNKFLIKEFKSVQNIKYFNYYRFVKDHKYKFYTFLRNNFKWFVERKYHKKYHQFLYDEKANLPGVNFCDYYDIKIEELSKIFKEYLSKFGTMNENDYFFDTLNWNGYECIINILNKLYNVYIYNISIYLETYLIKDISNISNIIIKYICI